MAWRNIKRPGSQRIAAATGSSSAAPTPGVQSRPASEAPEPVTTPVQIPTEPGSSRTPPSRRDRPHSLLAYAKPGTSKAYAQQIAASDRQSTSPPGDLESTAEEETVGLFDPTASEFVPSPQASSGFSPEGSYDDQLTATPHTPFSGNDGPSPPQRAEQVVPRFAQLGPHAHGPRSTANPQSRWQPTHTQVDTVLDQEIEQEIEIERRFFADCDPRYLICAKQFRSAADRANFIRRRDPTLFSVMTNIAWDLRRPLSETEVALAFERVHQLPWAGNFSNGENPPTDSMNDKAHQYWIKHGWPTIEKDSPFATSRNLQGLIHEIRYQVPWMNRWDRDVAPVGSIKWSADEWDKEISRRNLFRTAQSHAVTQQTSLQPPFHWQAGEAADRDPNGESNTDGLWPLESTEPEE